MAAEPDPSLAGSPLPPLAQPGNFALPPGEPIPDPFSFEKPRDPHWYKRAVFYEIHIRGFFDANGDGSGDFRGLTDKLDYLEWLGIDCIWLLPIYESPLRDGGYDISDFMRVLGDYGNIADFVELIEEAHKRGIRVIADLVMNHTSDQHPWFQASRSDPEGPFGDFFLSEFALSADGKLLKFAQASQSSSTLASNAREKP